MIIGTRWNTFLAAVKTAKITDFKFHDLRHIFASYLVMAGVPLNTITELLGHSTINRVLPYSHLTPYHKSESVEKPSTLLPQSNEVLESGVLSIGKRKSRKGFYVA